MKYLYGFLKEIISPIQYIFYIFRYFYYRLRVIYQERKENFDLSHGTDTEKFVSVKNFKPIGCHVKNSYGYEPTVTSVFNKIVASLVIQHREFSFIDIGAGKGRALMLAASYPFKKIIGVEFCKNLYETILRNIAMYRKESGGSQEFEVIHKDAVEYEFPSGHLVIYLFNPFDEKIMIKMTKKLKQITSQNGRKVVLIYCNPLYDKHLQTLRLRCAVDIKRGRYVYGWKIYYNF